MTPEAPSRNPQTEKGIAELRNMLTAFIRSAAIGEVAGITADTAIPPTEAACPDCGHDVDHTISCPDGCPWCGDSAGEEEGR